MDAITGGRPAMTASTRAELRASFPCGGAAHRAPSNCPALPLQATGWSDCCRWVMPRAPPQLSIEYCAHLRAAHALLLDCYNSATQAAEG